MKKKSGWWQHQPQENGETKNFKGEAEITIGNSSRGAKSAELGAKMKTIALDIL